jgi:hypothetical protein
LLKRCDEVIEAHYLVVRFADGSKRIVPIFSIGPQDRIGTLQGRDEGLQAALSLGRSLKRRFESGASLSQVFDLSFPNGLP